MISSAMGRLWAFAYRSARAARAAAKAWQANPAVAQYAEKISFARSNDAWQGFPFHAASLGKAALAEPLAYWGADDNNHLLVMTR
jgi:hypothetical protein